MKHRIFIGGLCITLALSLIACGNNQAQQEEQEPSQGVQQTDTETPTVEPAAKPVEVKQEIPQQQSGADPGSGPVDTAIQDEQKELSGAELIGYFQKVYDIVSEFHAATTPEELLEEELEFLVDLVESDAKKLPSDYQEQYVAWRPVDEAPATTQTPAVTLTFSDVSETVYATGTVNIRSGPSTSDEKIGSLARGNSITRTGIGTGDYANWSRVRLSDGSTAYVASSYLTTTKPATNSGTTNNGGGTQQTNPSTGTSTTKPSSGSYDPYDGYGSYSAMIDAYCQRYPQLSREEIINRNPDPAGGHVDQELAEATASEGRLTGGGQ